MSMTMELIEGHWTICKDDVVLVEHDIKKRDCFTNSRTVGELFDKKHKDILRAIDNLECSPEFNRRNFKLTKIKDNMGRKQRTFNMTQDGFTFLVMGFTGKKAAQFKEAYIKAFNMMYAFIHDRSNGILDRNKLTDAVKEAGLERGYYAAYTLMAYEKAGLQYHIGTKNFRDTLTKAQLGKLQEVEGMIAGLLNRSYTYDEIQQIV